jgi:type IV pilus assembly protein PilW
VNHRHCQSPLRRRHRGLSLVELMVGLAIGALLTIGLIQVFAASRATSQMQEGLSRVQENGRFATQYLQRQMRMVGYMGCGADVGRVAQASFVNHLAMFDGSVPGGTAYRFQRPLEGFTNGTMTLPAEFTGISGMVTNSDVLVLRVFSEESVPVLSIARSAMQLDVTLTDGSADFLPPDGSAALFALENCRSADVFAGTLAADVVGVAGNASPNVYLDPSVSSCGNSACPWDFRISNATLNSRPIVGGPPRLNAEMHRAEYLAVFVKNDANGIPGLYVRRFERDSTALADDPEQLVDGVENMQLRFGYDTSASPDGTIDEYRTAEEVVAGVTGDQALDDAWRRVLSVQVAMLMRSPERAAVSGDARTYDLLGVTLTPATDGAMRQVYETTIALRNRLFTI